MRWIRSRAWRRGAAPDRPPTDEEVDRVLDKVIEKGIDRLSARERGILDRASRHRRRPPAPVRTPPG